MGLMITFRYEQNRKRRWIRALKDDKSVGRLVWEPLTGVVYHAWVHPDCQRQGIGTAMWETSNSAAVPEAERPRRPLEPEVRNAAGDALYWAGRKRREARERGDTVPDAMKGDS